MTARRLSGCAISEASFQGRLPVGIASARRSNIANSRSLPASHVRTRGPPSSRPTSVYLSAMIGALRREPSKSFAGNCNLMGRPAHLSGGGGMPGRKGAPACRQPIGRPEEPASCDISRGVHRVRGGRGAAAAADGVPALRRLAHRGRSGADRAGEGLRVLAQDQETGRGPCVRRAHPGQHLSGPEAPEEHGRDSDRPDPRVPGPVPARRRPASSCSTRWPPSRPGAAPWWCCGTGRT